MTILGLYLLFGLPIALYFGLAQTEPKLKISGKLTAAFLMWLIWPLMVVWTARLYIEKAYVQWHCAWCGHVYSKKESWREHVLVCEKHPLKERADGWRKAAMELHDITQPELRMNKSSEKYWAMLSADYKQEYKQ